MPMTHKFMSLSRTDTYTSVSSVNTCLADILSWMESSKLMLNVDKTDIIIIDTNQKRNKIADYFPV